MSLLKIRERKTIVPWNRMQLKASRALVLRSSPSMERMKYWSNAEKIKFIKKIDENTSTGTLSEVFKPVVLDS